MKNIRKIFSCIVSLIVVVSLLTPTVYAIGGTSDEKEKLNLNTEDVITTSQGEFDPLESIALSSRSVDINPDFDPRVYDDNDPLWASNEYIDYLSEYESSRVCNDVNYYYKNVDVKKTGTRPEQKYEYLRLSSWTGYSTENHYSSGFLNPLVGKSQYDTIMRDKIVGSRQEYSFKTRSYERIYNYKKKTYEPYNVWKFKKWVSSGYWGTEEVWSNCAYKVTVQDGYKTTYLSNRWYSTYKSDTSTIDYRYVRKRTTYSLEYGSRTEYNYDLYKKTPKYREDCHGGFVKNRVWVDDSHWDKSGWTEIWRGSPWVKYAEETRSRETGYVVFNSSKAPQSGVHPDFGYAYINYDDVYGNWGNWSSYSPTVRTKSHIVDVRTITTYRKRPFAIETFNSTKSTNGSYLYLNSFSENVSYTYFEKEKRYFKNDEINRENAIKVEVNSSEWNDALNQGYTSFEPSGDDKVCYTRYIKGDLILEKREVRNEFLENEYRPIITIELLDHKNLPYFEPGDEKKIKLQLGSIDIPICKATNNYGEAFSCDVTVTDPLSNPPVVVLLEGISKAGTYLVTYTAGDSKGNKATPVEVELQLDKETSDGLTAEEMSQIDSRFEYDWDALENDFISYEFKEKVIQLAAKYGPNPDEFMMVMLYESGINPTKKNNQGSGATGLIQFMPFMSKALLLDRKIDDVLILDETTNERLRVLDTVEDKEEISDIMASIPAIVQLELVDKYLSWKSSINNLGDLYMAVFCVDAIGGTDSTKTYVEGVDGRKYSDNAKLDNNPKNGTITRKEAVDAVINNLKSKNIQKEE